MGILVAFLVMIVIELFLMSAIFPLPFTDSGTVRYRTVPYATIGLIVLNSLVFIVWTGPAYYQGINALDRGAFDMAYTRLGDYINGVWTYGFRSIYLREGGSIGAFTAITSMFMHADMWHLFGNMIYLWTFGRRVEDACGPWRYLTFYVLAGLVANLGSAVLNPADLELSRPSVGASGAIAGVMGAYLLLFPGAWITSLWGLGLLIRTPIAFVMRLTGSDMPFWRWTIRLPAWTLLFFFLIDEALASFEVMQQGRLEGGVNNLAHLTGFLAALMIIFFVRKDLLTRYFSGRRL